MLLQKIFSILSFCWEVPSRELLFERVSIWAISILIKTPESFMKYYLSVLFMIMTEERKNNFSTLLIKLDPFNLQGNSFIWIVCVVCWKLLRRHCLLDRKSVWQTKVKRWKLNHRQKFICTMFIEDIAVSIDPDEFDSNKNKLSSYLLFFWNPKGRDQLMAWFN